MAGSKIPRTIAVGRLAAGRQVRKENVAPPCLAKCAHARDEGILHDGRSQKGIAGRAIRTYFALIRHSGSNLPERKTRVRTKSRRLNNHRRPKGLYPEQMPTTGASLKRRLEACFCRPIRSVAIS